VKLLIFLMSLFSTVCFGEIIPKGAGVGPQFPSGILGSDGTSAPLPGRIGEIIESEGSTGAIGSGATGIPTTVVLTPGTWAVFGWMSWSQLTSSSNITNMESQIREVAALENDVFERYRWNGSWNDGSELRVSGRVADMAIPEFFTVSVPTTIYLLGLVTYTGGSMEIYGRLSAVRIY